MLSTKNISLLLHKTHRCNLRKLGLTHGSRLSHRHHDHHRLKQHIAELHRDPSLHFLHKSTHTHPKQQQTRQSAAATIFRPWPAHKTRHVPEFPAQFHTQLDIQRFAQSKNAHSKHKQHHDSIRLRLLHTLQIDHARLGPKPDPLHKCQLLLRSHTANHSQLKLQSNHEF